ncbi:melanocyte proliferating gene 1, putative [Eimeria maxima]|uniref:Melanocyte proliferating gene 1, putative n=1 Tax=Eimeria maxima TaxID=5804 RepID=U6M9Z4_EIMMA|nr:melanocyte proliferating gene 1, putative [Eimeria maxima]CDJ59868.1 melanocyte proliferating gene 1, putative [Eimeria maxima]
MASHLGQTAAATAADAATAAAACAAVVAAVPRVRISREEFWAMEGPVIGTHDGRYHLDEILACTMLLSLKEFKNSRICRSRDNNDLEKCSILVDVGGEYNLKNNHFDHHQRSFQQYFDFDRFASSGSQRGWNGNGDRDGSQNAEESCKRMKRKPVTKLSSAGLIFLHYGERILKERYGVEDPESVRLLMYGVYVHLLEAVDANDNGVSICPSSAPLYKETTTLASRIGALYPSVDRGEVDADVMDAASAWEYQLYALEEAWKQEEKGAAAFAAAAAAKGQGWIPPCAFLSIPIIGGDAETLWGFKKGLKMADEAFRDTVLYLRDTWLPSRFTLKDALLDNKAEKKFKDEVIELNHWMPIEDHLYDLERELDMVDCFKFVLYPTTKRDEGKNSITTWSVRCIPEERDKFKSRLPLKKEWRGMRDLELGQAVLQQQQQQQKAVAAASSSTINNNESSGGGDAGLTPDDFVFCHATGFLGIAKTRAAAYEMIRQTVEEWRKGEETAAAATTSSA